MIVLEAYAHGVPVIAASRGGLPEIVDDGVTGCLYDPAQPGALHAAIDRFVRQRERLDALRAGARAKAAEFVAVRMQQQYAALVECVAAEHRAREAPRPAAAVIGY
jgi:glycosyltransferase involved in cell wall biosynthesis